MAEVIVRSSLAGFRRAREEQSEKLRMAKREDIFFKRRSLISKDSQIVPEERQAQDQLNIVDPRYQEEISKFLKIQFTADHFPTLVSSINTGRIQENITNQHYGMIGIRKILSTDRNRRIQRTFDESLIRTLFDYASQQEYPQLQLEAVNALAIITQNSTQQSNFIVKISGIPLFLRLLGSKNRKIVLAAILALGNIASDNIYSRDAIIRNDAIPILVKVTMNSFDPDVVQNCCWVLSNLCRGCPLPKFSTIRLAFVTICKVLAEGRILDKQTMQGCCQAIYIHSGTHKHKIDAIVESGVIPQLIRSINEKLDVTSFPALRILVNASTGSPQQSSSLMNNNILDMIVTILRSDEQIGRSEACQILSNLVGACRSHVEAIISNEQLMKTLLKLFQNDREEIKLQICNIFSSMACYGAPQQIFNFYRSAGILKQFVDLLSSNNTQILQIVLECLFSVLQLGQAFKVNEKNLLVMDLGCTGAIDILERLQYHDSPQVYESTTKILKAYFQIIDPLDL